jgi:hypothetical protein
VPVPEDAFLFADPIDPTDRLDWLTTLDGPEGILETGETIASYTLTVTAEAAALGLEIGTATYAPTNPTNVSIKFWLECNSSFQNNAAFNADGLALGVELTVITSSTPPRRRQRTLAWMVKQL